MAASGARTQRPVGSAAWVSTEKENISQLVEQEMEEVEYPVAHEMDWLNEHMAEIFENNNFNFTEVFKTPGKLRGKTPRTARKRNVDDPRMPLSEVFSAAHNQVESRPNASPATKRSPAKTVAPTATTNAKHAPEKAQQQQPQYPSLPQNLNSFSQYNTDSGYHGLEHDDDDDDNEGDDDVVLTQVQSESQASTQPLDSQPWKNETDLDTSPIQASSSGRRMSESSFHSAREVRETTAEPPTVNTNAYKKTNARHAAPQSKQRELESSPFVYKPERETQPKRSFDKKSEETEKKPAKKTEQKPEQKQKEAKPAPKPAQTRAPKSQPRQEPEPESSPQPEPRSESVEVPKSSPAKTPATQPRAPRHEEEENYDDGDREDMELDALDDIGSPSDGSTPERPPIRKSSLSFASLPAREPLKKSLGPRMSRTSHIDVGKINGTGNPGFLGRQTSGHRTTQAGLEEHAPSDKMDIDDAATAAGVSRENGDDETRTSKQHNKSSTQRLHEKISMLGKMQPSRPTKSIPNVSNLSSAHVSYPELPSVHKADAKPETASRGSREMPAGDPMATDEDEWIKPLNTPQRPHLAKSQTFDVGDKSHKAPDRRFERDTSAARDHSMDEDRPAKPTESHGAELYRKSTTPVHSPPKRPMHQKSASVFNTAGEVSTTPIGSPRHQDVPLSASKWKLQSIMKSAKGLFSSTGSVSNAARVEASSPDEQREPPAESSTPTKPEGRETRGSAEREEKRKQKELEDRQRQEEAEREEKAREQEKQKAAQLKAAQEKASQEQERENERAASASAPSPKRIPQPQKQPSKEPEPANENSTKSGIPPPSSQQTAQKQNERRPIKPTREPLQKPKPQPVSIRVGSALSRQIPMAPGSNVQESSAPTAPTPASASKPPPTLKKKTSNNSLHTVPSNSSFKSSVSSTTQRKAQLASERKKEQEEREARRKEEQKREVERKRAAQQQQQEEARRQEMRSRAEAEKRERERQASEDPKKAAHMQAIEKRRLENARRLERQGSQQPSEPDRPASQASRPASRLGSVQPFNRSVNHPQPNPAKPPKRAMDDEPSNRPAPSKPTAVQPSGETKRRRTEDEHNPPPSVRPTMAPPIRQSTIRKEPKKPSLAGHGKPSLLNSAQATGQQSGSSIFNKTAQAQRPAHPMDMSKYASGKIPFSEAQQSGHSKTPGSSSAQKPASRPSPKYPSGENIQLPEIATDSEDEDSESDMLPMPKWARPEELEVLLREQEGMEVDSIFGPIAPFSLEETFKTDKRIKKFRERTSSANWSGADRLTQDEIRKDLAERQRLRLNGGWSFEAN